MTDGVRGPVVAGVDGSDSARLAAMWAAEEAAARRAPLRLVFVVHVPTYGYVGGAALTVDDARLLAEDARSELAGLRDRILATYPALEVETAVPVGPVVPALLDESADARLVVVGSRGLGGFTGLLAGSTAVGLVAHAHSPVAVIREDMADGPVVVGVDGSKASEAAVALAFEHASSGGADLVAVHTWTEYQSDVPWLAGRHYVVDASVIEEREREVLAERLAGWQEKYPDVRVQRVVGRDRPARCLIEHAAGARLLVMGSRGRGGLTGLLLGSTSQALVYHAPCPLLVARQIT